MGTRLKMKGIAVKQTKDGDEFVVKFEAVTDTFEDSVKLSDVIKVKLKNYLEGQKELEVLD